MNGEKSVYKIENTNIDNLSENNYLLEISGLINRPGLFTVMDIKQFEQHTYPIVIECAGTDHGISIPEFNSVSQPISQAVWSGCLLMDVIRYCGGFKSGAVDILFTGYDTEIIDGKIVNYKKSLNIKEDNILDDCLLVYKRDGLPLTQKHGFPLRLIVPGWYGMASVKYLKKIEVIPYQYMENITSSAKYLRDLTGRVTNIHPQAILTNPKTRIVSNKKGYISLDGLFWVGGSTLRRKQHLIYIVKVELSFDNGNNWYNSQIIKYPESVWGWGIWSYKWYTIPGLYDITIRATDNYGNTQPIWGLSSLQKYKDTGTICQHIRIHIV